MASVPPSQYATDSNLRARQRLWATSGRAPEFALYPWVIALADVGVGDRVLEVGCGNGEYLALVKAVGIDLSFGMLTAAQERTSGPLVCGNAEQLPFADESFDVVLAPHMLYHVDDRRAAARELRRVLERNGTCVAVTNGEDNHREMVDLVEDVVGRGWRWQRPSDSTFSLENGAAQLRAGFGRVERIDCPAVVVSVTDADALAGYLRSVGDHYEPQVSAWTTWEDVAAECHRRAAGIISTEGAFRISTSVGAFVCR